MGVRAPPNMQRQWVEWKDPADNMNRRPLLFLLLILAAILRAGAEALEKTGCDGDAHGYGHRDLSNTSEETDPWRATAHNAALPRR